MQFFAAFRVLFAPKQRPSLIGAEAAVPVSPGQTVGSAPFLSKPAVSEGPGFCETDGQIWVNPKATQVNKPQAHKAQ
jgi:hypothetical protein